MGREPVPYKQGKEAFNEIEKAYRHFYENVPVRLGYLNKGITSSGGNFYTQIKKDVNKYLQNTDCYSGSSLYNFFRIQDPKVRGFDKDRLGLVYKLIKFYKENVCDPKSIDEDDEYKVTVTTEGVLNSSQKNEISKKNEEKFEVDFSLFNYVACLDRINLQIPVSLIEKLAKEDWDAKKLSIVTSKAKQNIESIYDEETEAFYLSLTSTGKEIASSVEFQDALIFQILDYCDISINPEKELFEKITLKKFFFYALFKDFKGFDNLIYSKKFPSIDKQILLFRLKAFYYTERKDYIRMQENFSKCIALIKFCAKKSSSFYSNWADCETKFNQEEKAVEIRLKALEDLPFPQYNNRSIRLALSTYYYENGDKLKAMSFWKINDFAILREKGFIKIFSDFLYQLIKKNPKRATASQEFILFLIKELSNNGHTDLSKKLLKEINEIVSNNFKFIKALFYYYIREDKLKALEQLNKLELNEKVIPELVVCLYMDYFLAEKNPKLAIWHAEDYLNNNNSENPSLIYRKIGIIHFNNDDFNNARVYFEKLKKEELDSLYQYAIILSKSSPNEDSEEVFRIFRNYFKKYPHSTNSKAIGIFITFCLKHDKLRPASKLIFDKIQEINSNENYSKYFISFVYQQQLRLVVNNEQAEDILKEALFYSRDEKQKGIVYSGYAKHLMYRESNDTINNSSYDINEAIEYFKMSYNKRPDELTLFNIAKCYFHIEKYPECIQQLNKIKQRRYNKEKIFLKLKALFFLRDFKEIKRITNEVKTPKIRGVGLFYLAQNRKLPYDTREEYFDEAIKLNDNTEAKFEFAVFYHKNSKREKGRKLINNIKSIINNEEEKIRLENDYRKRISQRILKANSKLVKKIETSIETLDWKNKATLKGIDNLLGKFPLDINVHKLKFSYFFKTNDFDNCDKILNYFTQNNIINNETAECYLKLSKSYYKYSQYKKVSRKRQINALIKAFKYMEYVLKVSQTTDNIALYAVIPFKQGNFKKHNKILNLFNKKLESEEIEKLKNKVDSMKKNIKIFLWETRDDDYSNRLQFYKNQEKLAANIIRTSNQVFLSKPLKILNSIILDTEFHKENNFIIFNSVITRLGHYYYHLEDYKSAYYYKKQVYKTKIDDVSFIRAFLKTTDKVADNKKQYEEALGICDFYLENIETPSIYRHKGNFLKELERYQEAFDAYSKALNMFDESYNKLMILNNIIILCHTCLIEKNQPFDSIDNLKQTANNSFREILAIDSNYRYKNSTFNKLSEINSYS